MTVKGNDFRKKNIMLGSKNAPERRSRGHLALSLSVV